MSDVVRIAVVGFGLIGKRHAAALSQSPNLALAAIVEPDEARQKNARHFQRPVYSSLAQLLDAFVPDGVIIATPTPLHTEQGSE